jgi:hypothetical protein
MRPCFEGFLDMVLLLNVSKEVKKIVDSRSWVGQARADGLDHRDARFDRLCNGHEFQQICRGKQKWLLLVL